MIGATQVEPVVVVAVEGSLTGVAALAPDAPAFVLEVAGGDSDVPEPPEAPEDPEASLAEGVTAGRGAPSNRRNFANELGQ